jgi:Xaa-Pro dipeptidase
MEHVKKSELAERHERLRSWMRKESVDAAFVFQNVDVFYFSGTAQSGLLCLPAEAPPCYLVQKSLIRARAESPLDRILPFPGFKKLAEALAGEGIRNPKIIGIETDVLPASYYIRLKELFPEAMLVDASDAIRRIRAIKSEHEVAQIRCAAEILRLGFDRLPDWIRPGATELEVMAHLEGYMRELGHQGMVRTRGFNNQIGYGTFSSGVSANSPTSFPGPVGSFGMYRAVPTAGSGQVLATGESMIADLVGGYGGYHADKTRVFVLGRLPEEMENAHRFVLDLNHEIESILKPGTLCSRIYQFAMERVKDSPYAAGFMGAQDNQVRFVGHGIGLELDEYPALACGFDLPLQAGMTIAVEPKIFFEGRGGVGVENTYLITGSGFENLTPYREELISVPY